MGRWITGLFTTHADVDMDVDGGCPVCDHPFGDLKHACISSIAGSTPAVVALPVRVPEPIVA